MRSNLAATFACTLIAVLAARPLAANEIGGNFAWQFRTASDRAVAAQALDMMLRREAGGYGPASLTQNYTTNFAGDQVNCSVGASAIGNSGSAGTTGAASSPSLGNTPSIFAQATGSSVASQGLSGSLSSPLNSTQTNTSSPQSAAVAGTTSQLTANQLQAQGGTLTQALNLTQGNSASPQVATVNGSTACARAGSTR